MPPPKEILELLAAAAHELTGLALAWHVVLVGFLVAFLLGWRPAPRRVAPLLAAPILSVGIVALAYGNLFNGISFFVLAIVLVGLGRSLPGRHVSAGPAWSRYLGVALILFGMWYPHFVEGAWYRVLAVSPFGIVPCATLALVAGATLLADGFGSRAILAVLALWTGFYAHVGVLRLHVLVDLGLLVAMLGLTALLVHEALLDEPRRTRGLGARFS